MQTHPADTTPISVKVVIEAFGNSKQTKKKKSLTVL